MGHDIYLDDEHVTGVTGNYYLLCEQNRYVFINQIHGMYSMDILAMCVHTINKLTNRGIDIQRPDKSNLNWGWGCDKDGNKFTEEVFLGVYMYILTRWMRLAIDKPRAKWTVNDVFRKNTLCKLELDGYLPYKYESICKYGDEEKISGSDSDEKEELNDYLILSDKSDGYCPPLSSASSVHSNVAHIDMIDAIASAK